MPCCHGCAVLNFYHAVATAAAVHMAVAVARTAASIAAAVKAVAAVAHAAVAAVPHPECAVAHAVAVAVRADVAHAAALASAAVKAVAAAILLRIEGERAEHSWRSPQISPIDSAALDLTAFSTNATAALQQASASCAEYLPSPLKAPAHKYHLFVSCSLEWILLTISTISRPAATLPDSRFIQRTQLVTCTRVNSG